MTAEVPISRRFLGSVRLVTLHLWKVGKSTDIDKCILAASELGMLDNENIEFIRRCMEIAQSIETGNEDRFSITENDVHELQMCAIRLNAADPA